MGFKDRFMLWSQMSRFYESNEITCTQKKEKRERERNMHVIRNKQMKKQINDDNKKKSITSYTHNK